jgi:putative transposase
MQFINDHKDQWSVRLMCRVLHVSESGYYKHKRNEGRPDKHAALLATIYELLKTDPENANYGVNRIYLYLKDYWGYTGSYSTIYRICRGNNLIIQYKRRPKGLTKADPETQKAENLLQQDFTAEEPNKKWLTDITEIPCIDGKLYLAPVLDCFDGSIRGFKMDSNMRAELCVEAFERACRSDGAKGMILHSDRGSQFTSSIFRKALKKHGAIQSMSSVGRCYDNARMESFFATLKKEKLYPLGTVSMTIEEVKTVVYRYINYYNRRRIYSTNGGWPPLVFRQIYWIAHQSACA